MSEEIICRVVFEGANAAAQAADLKAQIDARMTNATVRGLDGTPSASYVRYESDGALVSMSFVDEFGIVRQGEYIQPDPYPVWMQPTGAQDAYPLLRLDGDPTRVMYQGEAWQNTGSDANVWAPGVFGWTRVADL